MSEGNIRKGELPYPTKFPLLPEFMGPTKDEALFKADDQGTIDVRVFRVRTV